MLLLFILLSIVLVSAAPSNDDVLKSKRALKKGDVCTQTSDCDTTKGLFCKIPYKTCVKGWCLCPPGQTSYNGAACAALNSYPLWIGDACPGNYTGYYIGPMNARCIDNMGTNTVVCEPGYTAAGVTFCVKDDITPAFLGSTCSPGTTTCYGYKERGLVVSSAWSAAIACVGASGSETCQCTSAYKKVGFNCVAKTIGDACWAGADCHYTTSYMICMNSQCACKEGTVAVNGECQIFGAATEGNACISGPGLYSFNKTEACVQGLTCGYCPGETGTKCVKLNSGPAAVQEGGICTQTSDCDTTLGLSCKIPYKTCAKGICRCPSGQISYNGAACAAIISPEATTLWIGDPCTGNDTYSYIGSYRGICIDTFGREFVGCPTGYSASGVTICVKDDYTEGKLGSTCISGTTTCYGYEERGAVISSFGTAITCAGASGSQTCQCTSGYKKVGFNCVARAIGDACASNADCHATTTYMICTASKCGCKTGTAEVNGVCQISGAVTEGNVCSVTTGYHSFVQTETCVQGLTCGSCPGETSLKCLMLNSGPAESDTEEDCDDVDNQLLEDVSRKEYDVQTAFERLMSSIWKTIYNIA